MRGLVWVCVYLNTAFGGQRRVLDPVELEFHAVLSCLMWGLGTETKYSGRTVLVLNH